MTHEDRARKIANLINSQHFSGLLEDLLVAQFTDVERKGVERALVNTDISALPQYKEMCDRIAMLEAALEKADELADTTMPFAVEPVEDARSAYRAARAKVKP